MYSQEKGTAKRVRESYAAFIESRLHLKVNRDKTEVVYLGKGEVFRLFHLCDEREMQSSSVLEISCQGESETEKADIKKQR